MDRFQAEQAFWDYCASEPLADACVALEDCLGGAQLLKMEYEGIEYWQHALSCAKCGVEVRKEEQS